MGAPVNSFWPKPGIWVDTRPLLQGGDPNPSWSLYRINGYYPLLLSVCWGLPPQGVPPSYGEETSGKNWWDMELPPPPPPPLGEEIKDAGLEYMEVYIVRRKKTVDQHIVIRNILDLFTETEQRPGAQVPKMWWEQLGMTLWGIGRRPMGKRGRRKGWRTAGSLMTKAEGNTVSTKYH